MLHHARTYRQHRRVHPDQRIYRQRPVPLPARRMGVWRLRRLCANEKYVPRQEPPSRWAGGKMVNFDRVEWTVIPDPATQAGALQRGEADWIEQPSFDLLPSLRKMPGVTVEVLDYAGRAGDDRREPHPAAFRQSQAAASDFTGGEPGRLSGRSAGRGTQPGRQGGDLHPRIALCQHRRDRGDHRQARRGAGQEAGGGKRLQGRADRADVAGRPAATWCRWRK